MEQQELWHDTLEDAIRSAVDALGGPKAVADKLWPSKALDDARRHLLHCLNPDNDHKLSLYEFKLIGQWASEAGCHVIAAYLSREWHYAPPVPIDPETEHAKRQREFIESVDRLQKLVKQLGVEVNSPQLKAVS